MEVSSKVPALAKVVSEMTDPAPRGGCGGNSVRLSSCMLHGGKLKNVQASARVNEQAKHKNWETIAAGDDDEECPREDGDDDD